MQRPKAIVKEGEQLRPLATAGNVVPGTDRRRVWTQAETREHVAFLEQLYVRGTSLRQMELAARQRFGLRPGRVTSLLDRIRETWRKEDEANRASNRAAAVRRVTRYIRDAEGRKNQDGSWIEKPNYAALARFEELLSDLQGTREPVKVDLNVRVQETVLNVIAGLSPEELGELVAEYEDTERLAEAARRGLVIDTTGEAVRA